MKFLNNKINFLLIVFIICFMFSGCGLIARSVAGTESDPDYNDINYILVGRVMPEGYQEDGIYAITGRITMYNVYFTFPAVKTVIALVNETRVSKLLIYQPRMGQAYNWSTGTSVIYTLPSQLGDLYGGIIPQMIVSCSSIDEAMLRVSK